MNGTKHLSLLLLSLSTAAALANEASLRALAESVRRQPDSEKALAIFSGMADLPDMDLSGAAAIQALRQGGLPGGAQVDEALGRISRLSKSGPRVRITLTGKAAFPAKDKGWVRLAPVVEFKVRRSGAAIVLDGFSGVTLARGKTGGLSISLKKVQVTNPAPGKTMADFTAGWVWPLEKTVTVELSKAGGFAGALPP